MGCLILSLVGCSSKKVTKLYTPDLKEDKEVCADIVESMRQSLQFRYDLDNNKLNNFSSLFVNNNDIENKFESYKISKQELTNNKLDITNYFKSAREIFYEMKDWGLKHCLLYTDGTKTDLDVIVEEITPLNPGEQYSNTDKNNEVNDIQNGLTDEEIELKVAEKEAELLSMMPIELQDVNAFEYSIELDDFKDATQIESELLVLLTLDDIANYINDNFFWYADFPIDYVPYLDEATENMSEITIDIWNNYSLDEARNRALSILLNSYQIAINQSTLDLEYYNSQEFKDKLIVGREEYLSNVERQKNKLREELLAQRNETTVSDEYLIWCKSYEDYINYIENHDFTSEGLSAVIQEEDGNYYILWDYIYQFADENGKLPLNIEFVGFGDTFKITTPQAPLDYYKDKEIKVIEWKITEDSAGVKGLSISFNFPDIQEKVDVSFSLNDNNKLIYDDKNILKLFQ